MQKNEKYFIQIKSELEQTLLPLIPKAKIYFKDDDGGYFIWLSKASTLKSGAPQIPFEELTPEKLSRPLGQVIKENSEKK